MELSSAEILGRIENCGVFSKEELDELRTSVASLDANISGEKLINELLRINWLTPFQATAIWENNAQRMGFGNYVILDELGGAGWAWCSRHDIGGCSAWSL